MIGSCFSYVFFFTGCCTGMFSTVLKNRYVDYSFGEIKNEN